MAEQVVLENISIVLHRPRFPENIGAAARAMRNMGMARLVVVDPEHFDLERILRMATHAAADVIDDMSVADELAPALSDFHFVVGTTARLGKQRQVIQSPDKLAHMLVPVSRENRIALLFGPEDRGLSNEDLRLCHALVNIPTADFASLNLAQAVMILCYEIARAGRGSGDEIIPRLASRHELDGMYAQLMDVLVKISFINPENPDYWMHNLRRFFTRLRLRAREVNIIRGICRQIDWYGKKKYDDGRKAEAEVLGRHPKTEGTPRP